MKLTIHPFSLCRTPIFSSDVKIEKVWNDLKLYIEEASPAFFDIIKNYKSDELQLLEPKIKFTLWKYFNRAQFRATPFGNFATFSLVPVGKEEDTPIIQTAGPVTYRFPDWSEKEQVNLNPVWLLENAGFLRANTSAYLCSKQIRYISFVEGTFELSEVNSNKIILDTLAYCHTPRRVDEIKNYLEKEHQLNEVTIKFLLEQFIELQLFFSDFHPNITGSEYFNRIGSVHPIKHGDYIIAERKVHRGQLNGKKLQVLAELANFLCKHIPYRKNAGLNDFRNKFLARFEHQAVPLLVAIDPELGVNYMAFEQESGQDELVEELKKESLSQQVNTGQPITALYKYILNQLSRQETIQLDNYKGIEITPQATLANTTSSLITFCDDLMVTSQIGGVTANALLGRFTLVSEELIQKGKELVEIEEQANPDVIFFDIAYQAEKHVDNINRRKSLYKYELPILTWTESNQVLDLDDIVLSVTGEELVLHSIKHQKRLIPRLASAYNYTRSDLTIFRFLSDLQHQNVHLALTVNPEQVLPGLDFYPRIQYKNLVLSPAKWLVPSELCHYKALPFKALSSWLESTGIGPRKFFKCGNGDQILCFNTDREEDQVSFLNYCRNKSEYYVEEAFIPVNAVIKDEDQQPYLSEFIVTLSHQQQLYTPYPLKKNELRKAGQPVPQMYLPGGEWLYAEIYCHASRSNALLQFSIKRFIAGLNDKIKEWFFIRYNSPSDHIRLRLRLKDPKDGYEVMNQLSKTLQPDILSGVIADLQLKIYKRENDRYGAQRIHLAESYFCINSELVMDILKYNFTIPELYAISLKLIGYILCGASYSLVQQLSLAEGMASAFDREMKIGAEGHKKINQSYRTFNTDHDNGKIRTIPEEQLLKIRDAALDVISSADAEEAKTLLTDLFHMHVNRLFYVDQRMHELVIYHYLTKMLKTRIGRQKNMDLPNSEQTNR
ncbi:thiopeptide-type bacteriocin biosynthesis protein [Pedobacter sp. AW31-3R]|uniref:lantibiotic dehydratase n=1 Tax=Pedobacter sp. AW31-3R TaxID=3445781 RepID=UPI003FA003AA